jgi:ketosteroid isomerase-like protein
MANDRDLILQAEDKRKAALAAVDITVLDGLFSDDLVHVHSNGIVQDKAALLSYIQESVASVVIERGPLNVRLFGDVAIVIGPMTNHTRRRDGTEVVLKGTATQVLKREAANWRFVSFQLTLTGA